MVNGEMNPPVEVVQGNTLEASSDLHMRQHLRTSDSPILGHKSLHHDDICRHIKGVVSVLDNILLPG